MHEIIETYTLLRILKLFRKDKVTKEKIISILKKEDRLLSVSDFEQTSHLNVLRII